MVSTGLESSMRIMSYPPYLKSIIIIRLTAYYLYIHLLAVHAALVAIPVNDDPLDQLHCGMLSFLLAPRKLVNAEQNLRCSTFHLSTKTFHMMR